MEIPGGGRAPGLTAETFHTGDHLANARRQAEAGIDDMLVIDADAHVYEKESILEIIPLIEDPIVRQLARSAQGAARQAARFPLDRVAYHEVGGRIVRDILRRLETTPGEDAHRAAELALRAMDAMGIDVAALSPFGLQIMGLHPQPEVEAGVLGAYNRWLTERVLPASPRLLGWIMLPFSAPGDALRTVETYAGHPGIAGFQVTSLREKSVHDNAYMPVYAAIEETGLPIAFHGGTDWEDPLFRTVSRFMAVKALSQQWYNIVHCTNWVVNGMPERFPRMPVIWMDSGISWVPWLMMRIDNEYRMRSS
ncbi:MAG: amidohydrolase family protein, partial [Defluviicoccus sp.]|nr:amidohydrolase family protein [Defluviicoccus sp.]